MNKEALIALGLTDEQTTKVLEGYKGFVPQSRLNEVITERDNFKTQVTERDTQLEKIKKEAGDNETLKKQIEDFKADNTKTKQDYEAKINQIKLDSLLENALKEAGAKNVKAVKALLDSEKIKLEGDGIAGVKEQLEALKKEESSKFLFNEQKEDKKVVIQGFKPGETIQVGAEGFKNPWSKDSRNLTEQGKILKADPELAKTLQAQAQ